MNEAEVVIVGGGAAGIGAAHTLADAGVSCLIVEAADRLGGRAHTVHRAGMPLDLGAGWLHSAQHNPWIGIAEAAGFTVDRTRPRWREQWHELGFSRTEQRQAGDAFGVLVDRMRSDPPASDRAGDLLDPDCPWNAYLEAMSGYINSVGTAQVSVADYLAYDDVATETDWRVHEGYGALVAWHAAGLRVALQTPVSAIDTHGVQLVIRTPRGPIRAGKAIVTASTTVLARGAIRFGPSFDTVLHAAASLPLGTAEKLFLAVDGAEAFDDNAHLVGNPRNPATGAYTLRPFGRPVIEVLLGGEGAAAAVAAGLDGAAAVAIEELCALLGSEWRSRLRLLAGSSWTRDDHIGGGYSHALPGKRDARMTLAMPVDARVRFAGEACSPGEFSTVHGAYKTGVAAAKALLG